MANFAILSGSQVTNIIVAKDLKTAESVTKEKCVEYTEENPAGIGWNYIDGVFVAPVIAETTDGIA